MSSLSFSFISKISKAGHQEACNLELPIGIEKRVKTAFFGQSTKKREVQLRPSGEPQPLLHNWATRGWFDQDTEAAAKPLEGQPPLQNQDMSM